MEPIGLVQLISGDNEYEPKILTNRCIHVASC
jgi:hypothetical protein